MYRSAVDGLAIRPTSGISAKLGPIVRGMARKVGYLRAVRSV
jgi:hypothetical protein